MGAGSSHKSKYFIDSSNDLMKIDVSKIPITESTEKQNELRNISKEILIKMGDLGFKERYDNASEIVFSRWNWILENNEKFVNILRINGFQDDCIQEAFNGIKPLTIKTKETFDQFCERIFLLKEILMATYKIKELRVAIIGSSLYGFSNNPLKGGKEIPSNIAKIETCDFDFVFIGHGIDEVVKNIKQKNSEDVKNFQYIDDYKRIGIRYRIKRLEENMNSVFEWKKEMKNFLKRKIKIYFQEGDGNLPPWEAIIDYNFTGCC